jgi:hypothetical protein
MLASSVLSGNLTSDNATAEIIDDTEGTTHAETMYKYHVLDKRSVGSIRPELVGRCALKDRFLYQVPAGSSYGHHTDLAHRLILDQPSITAVLTSPATREHAAFIESEILPYEERPNPVTLDPNESLESLRAVLASLHRTATTSQRAIMPSPQPHLLHAEPHNLS